MKKRGLKVVLIIIIAAAALSAVVMLLWNELIPEIFGLASINFWQALGLFLLARILFGRFGFKGSRMMHRRGGHMREKWRNMTPEQRKEFIEKRRQFGYRRRYFDSEAQAQQGDGNE